MAALRDIAIVMDESIAYHQVQDLVVPPLDTIKGKKSPAPIPFKISNSILAAEIGMFLPYTTSFTKISTSTKLLDLKKKKSYVPKISL